MIPSAADFLPSYIRLFMNFARTRSPYLASGLISRRSARRRRDMCVSSRRLFRTLRAVERTALAAVFHALRVEHATNDVITHARKVFHATAAKQHHGVFLKIVTFAGNVCDDFISVGQTHFRDFAKCRVRLLRRRRIDARADATLLWISR